MRGAIYYISSACLFFCLSLILPVAGALVYGDFAIAYRFGLYAALGTFLCSAVLLALRGCPVRVSRIGGFILAVIIWLLFIFLTIILLMDIGQLTVEKAVFEAVSGLTTSGGSVFTTKSAISKSLLLWRSQLEWIGGFMTISMVVLVLAPAGAGGLPTRNLILYNPNATDSTIHIRQLLGEIGFIYVTTTIIAAGLLWVFDTDPFAAVNLALMGSSTGGFVAFDGALDERLTPVGLSIMAVLLFIGASNVFWMAAIREGRWKQAALFREPYIFLGLVFFIALLIVLRLQQVSGSQNIFGNFDEAVFNAVSLLSTSGVESRPGIFALLSVPSLLFLVFFGGCSFSTAGGIKLYRLGAMATQCLRELNRLVYPNIVQSERYGQGQLNLNGVAALWSYFVLAVFTIFAGFVALSVSGLSFSSAITASVVFFANAAPFFQAAELQTAQATFEFNQFSTSAFLVSSCLMFIGRLEVIVILGAVNYALWRRN